MQNDSYLGSKPKDSVVVLVGFSTSGKSSLARDLKDQFPGTFDIFDTDIEIAKEEEVEHIWQVYYKWLSGTDTRPATNRIASIEESLLRKIRRKDRPQLIVTGPGVPIRDGWSDFLKLVKPEVVIHLEVSPEEVLAGLLRRCTIDAEEGGAKVCNRAYGCWEQGQTRAYNPTTSRWELLSHDVALTNIRANMAKQVAAYKGAANRVVSGRLRECGYMAEYDSLILEIARELGIA